MAITIGSSNISSLQAQKSLGDATSKVAKAYQQLSSGLRINQASDDAAGLAIATQLDSNSRVFAVAVRNVNDGVSASNIAEGALKGISQRQLELAEQAANGTYSLSQRQALNKEASALTDEYNRIVSTTTFNGLSLLDPKLGTVLIQAGYGKSSALQLGLSDQLARTVGDGTFTAGQSQAFANLSATVAVDANTDGRLDIIEAVGGNGISVTLGNGDGTFKATTSIALGPTAVGIAAGDVNGDGIVDVVVGTSSGSSNTLVRLGNGDGTFAVGQTFSLGFRSSVIALVDLNNDGKLDVIKGDTLSQVTIALGNGDGRFNAPAAPVIGPYFSISDLDNDGIVDLATSDATTLRFYKGNGNGTFASARTLAAGAFGSVQIADFNNDGLADIAASTSSGQTTVLFGTCDGNFVNPQVLLSAGSPYDLSAVDLNGDGFTDLITGNSAGADSVFLSNGNGSFTSELAGNTFSGTRLSFGDFDGNGTIDFAGAANGSGQLSVLLNNSQSTSQVAHLNIATAAGARSAIGTVNGNLARIESQLGTLGAVGSRFQTALSNLQTQSQNFQDAVSRINDVDVAQESSVLVRTQILQQSAASVLAQANQQPALALKLLGG